MSESHIAPEDEDGTDDASILDAAAWVAASGSARTVELVTVQDHPLGQGFVDVTVPWDGTRIVHALNGDLECTAGGATESDDPPLAHDGWAAAVAHGASGQTAIWERAVGAGRVIVLGHPSLLANAAINEHDNKRFAMNLIAAHLGPNGQLLFDDAHQGDSDLYTPSDLLSDIRVLQTLGFLLVCWAVYVLADAGSWERATRRETPSASGQAALVRASGDYLARRLRSTALAEGLLAPLRERLAGKWQLPMDRALIDGLEREGIDATTRRDLVQRLATKANKGMNAVKLHNLILALRREVR